MKISSLVRRSAVVLISAVALTSLAGCSTSASTSSEDAVWSYTDATGKTVNLDHEPERIASFSDYALGLLSNDISPVAIFGRIDVATDARFADYDVSDTAIVGNSYGEIDLEKLTEAAPDLIITGIYPTDRKGSLDTKGPLYGLADVEQQEQLEKIAPIIAIEVGGKGSDVIESSNKLAEALGADPATIAAAKEKYDAAAADLSAAAKENPIELTQMYADADGIYVVKPMDEPETELYTSLGVKFTDLNPDGDFYWDIYSWENAADMMTGDVLLVSDEGFKEADLQEQPTFATHKALVAGQIHPWIDVAFDYTSQAQHMEELAAIIRASKKL